MDPDSIMSVEQVPDTGRPKWPQRRGKKTFNAYCPYVDCCKENLSFVGIQIQHSLDLDTDSTKEHVEPGSGSGSEKKEFE